MLFPLVLSFCHPQFVGCVTVAGLDSARGSSRKLRVECPGYSDQIQTMRIGRAAGGEMPDSILYSLHVQGGSVKCRWDGSAADKSLNSASGADRSWWT